MRAITEIIIHCTGTPVGRTVTVDEIDAWHRQRGYARIGYHYVIYIDGSVHLGRDETQMGAHCVGHNKNSIGVCYVGGCDKDMKPADTRTYKQKNAMRDLVRQLLHKYPAATVHGHNEFSDKACPSFDVRSWLKTIDI